MRKEPYQEHPARYEYRLTEKGRYLVPILTSHLAWGDKWETEDATSSTSNSTPSHK